MKQSPYWEADSHSTSQEIPCLFMEPKDSLLYSQEPTIGPYLEPDESSPYLPNLFL
jgi:hypothetical protein